MTEQNVTKISCAYQLFNIDCNYLGSLELCEAKIFLYCPVSCV